MALNHAELETRQPKPVSLPRFNLPDIDLEQEAKEAAERVATNRIIRQGRDAWHAIGKAQSFESWQTVGAALAIGKQRALRATGANDTSSRHYIKWFSRWLLENGFGVMKPQTRSWAIALYENAEAITAWRDGLPTGRGRRRPVDPQSCVKGWQRSQANGNGHAAQDWKREAVAAWRRFVYCVERLPLEQAAPLWAMAIGEATNGMATAHSVVSGQRTASDAAAVSPAISAAVAAAADARAAESGTAQTETAQTGTGQTITSTSTASAPQVVVREGPQGFVRVRPLHPAWGGKEPPERP